MPAKNGMLTHLNIRLDPKVHYILQVASQITGKNKTALIEDALNQAFRSIYMPDAEVKPEDIAVEDRLAPVGSLAHCADAIWDDNPGKRLFMRVNSCEFEQDKYLVEYILAKDEYSTETEKGRLPRFTAIADNWEAIRAAALIGE